MSRIFVTSLCVKHFKKQNKLLWGLHIFYYLLIEQSEVGSFVCQQLLKDIRLSRCWNVENYFVLFPVTLDISALLVEALKMTQNALEFEWRYYQHLEKRKIHATFEKKFSKVIQKKTGYYGKLHFTGIEARMYHMKERQQMFDHMITIEYKKIWQVHFHQPVILMLIVCLTRAISSFFIYPPQFPPQTTVRHKLCQSVSVPRPESCVPLLLQLSSEDDATDKSASPVYVSVVEVLMASRAISSGW